MANVSLWGASYSDVPAVTLPQTGGGSAVFYEETGALQITRNGTFDVSGYASAVVSVSGGGISITDEPNATGTTLVVTGDGGGGGATQHNIYFEFTDGTDTTIQVYYDDALIGTMITAYEPTTYGGKTVDLAQLDGATWYTRPTETWETLYDGNTNLISDTPYPYWWISSLSSITIAVGSVWRITIDNVTYPVLTATDQGSVGAMIGNPLYNGGTDDGSGIPFCFFNAGWGAWSGGADMTGDRTYSVKIERRVSA